MQHTVLSVVQARIGDRNDLAMQGAQALGAMLAQGWGLEPEVLGSPMPAVGTGWKAELALALPELKLIAAHFDRQLSLGKRLLTASSRCAASLATVPAVARHRPDACIVWFDAHADLNTPATTSSGYLACMLHKPARPQRRVANPAMSILMAGGGRKLPYPNELGFIEVA